MELTTELTVRFSSDARPRAPRKLARFSLGKNQNLGALHVTFRFWFSSGSVLAGGWFCSGSVLVQFWFSSRVMLVLFWFCSTVRIGTLCNLEPYQSVSCLVR